MYLYIYLVPDDNNHDNHDNIINMMEWVSFALQKKNEWMKIYWLCQRKADKMYWENSLYPEIHGETLFYWFLYSFIDTISSLIQKDGINFNSSLINTY